MRDEHNRSSSDPKGGWEIAQVTSLKSPIDTNAPTHSSITKQPSPANRSLHHLTPAACRRPSDLLNKTLRRKSDLEHHHTLFCSISSEVCFLRVTRWLSAFRGFMCKRRTLEHAEAWPWGNGGNVDLVYHDDFRLFAGVARDVRDR